MSVKQKALKLAEELGLTIHKVHAAHVTESDTKMYYYIIGHKDSVAHDDFREHPNPSKAFVYLNEDAKQMIFCRWKECIEAMLFAKEQTP